jgi:hypothetical protein
MLLLAAILFLRFPTFAKAQDDSSIFGSPPVAAVDPDQTMLSDDQLQQLLAPIALYPDPLLAQMLPASTYPLQIVAAQRWLQGNASPTEAAIDGQQLEPSVKAMMHYPTVLQMMNDQLDWTQSLGVAFVNQQADVMNAIQELRQQALTAGTLQSTPQQQVIQDEDGIQILPVDPNMIYVPQYDPNSIYDNGGSLTFGIGFPEGIWLDNDFDWHNHWLAAGEGWNHGWDSVRDRKPGEEYPQSKAWSRNRAQPLPVRKSPPAPEANRAVHTGYADPKAPQRPATPNAFNGYEKQADVQHSEDRANVSRPAPAPRAAPPEARPAPAPRAAPAPPQQAFHPTSGAAAAAQSARGNQSQAASGGGGGGAARGKK